MARRDSDCFPSEEKEVDSASWFFVSAINQMGYRLSPQFSHMVVWRYDIHTRSRITLDNFIQSCVLLKNVTDTFRAKDTAGTGNINISYEEFMTVVMNNKP